MLSLATPQLINFLRFTINMVRIRKYMYIHIMGSRASPSKLTSHLLSSRGLGWATCLAVTDWIWLPNGLVDTPKSKEGFKNITFIL